MCTEGKEKNKTLPLCNIRHGVVSLSIVVRTVGCLKKTLVCSNVSETIALHYKYRNIFKQHRFVKTGKKECFFPGQSTWTIKPNLRRKFPQVRIYGTAWPAVGFHVNKSCYLPGTLTLVNFYSAGKLTNAYKTITWWVQRSHYFKTRPLFTLFLSGIHI